jgi:hypothetical protein
VLLALVLTVALQGQPALSPEAEAMFAPLTEAVAKVRARHAALPPPRDEAEQLIRMGELDQAPRRLIGTLDFSKFSDAERPVALKRLSAIVEEIDAENQAALLKMVPPEGWFLRSRYGEQAADAAFHIVQHGDLSLWRRFVPILEPLVAKGEVRGWQYGLMYDRLAISKGRPQRYGSQFRCDNGEWRPYPIEEPSELETRRVEMGFVGSFEDYKQAMQAGPPCPQTRSPPPPGMNVTDE